MLNYRLPTVYGERLDRDAVLPEYPRPQLRRDGWLNLNGEWGYSVNKTGDITGAPDATITVPFPPESALSGIMSPPHGGYMIYTRNFSVPEGFLRDITLLHIGAADQECEVFLNGVRAGGHAGGYLPFSLDVTAAVRPGENTLTVRVRDTLSYGYPTGKQRRRRGGIWYTPVSGIWQTVWLESVPRGYIRALTLTSDPGRRLINIEIDSESTGFDIVVSAAGRVLARETAAGSRVSLEIPESGMRMWSPEEPFLYDLTVSAGGDSIASYFAMRTFTAQDGRFLLNGRPYFVNGLLDQGYFSDGIYTPASYDAYADDIRAMKALGFNTLRKHIKIEPMRFYYLCDTLGMLVLQDMVNVGRYSFFKDTVLPFSGLFRHRPYVNVNKKQRECFTSHALETQRLLHNCPCVVYYTIFNEGWGQFDGDGLYRLLKAADPTRVYDATSGWFEEKLSDVESRHIYFKPVVLKRTERPQIVSEFGGYSYSHPGHVFNTDKVFGYRKYDSCSGFEDGFVALYENEILPARRDGSLAGAIYTQLSDVEDETNGILTYDRRFCKLNAKRILPLMRRICSPDTE